MRVTVGNADKEMGKKSAAVRTKLIERTTQCEAIASRGQSVLAQEVVQTVDLPHPIYIESAEGPYLTDLDGNSYIDLTGGFGPNVLGNKP
jgi:glutamate-1-semialdehyde aminotransferase